MAKATEDSKTKVIEYGEQMRTRFSAQTVTRTAHRPEGTSSTRSPSGDVAAHDRHDEFVERRQEAITRGDVWSQRVIKAVTGGRDQQLEFLRDMGPDPDASSLKNPRTKLVGGVVEAFRDKVGRRTRALIEDSIEFALCQTNGNAVHEAAKLMLDAREIMSAADIAKCIRLQSTYEL